MYTPTQFYQNEEGASWVHWKKTVRLNSKFSFDGEQHEIENIQIYILSELFGYNESIFMHLHMYA